MSLRIEWASSSQKITLVELARHAYRLRSERMLRLLRYDLLFQHALVATEPQGSQAAAAASPSRSSERSWPAETKLDARPVAFASFALVADELRIGWFGVAPGCRRQGVGTQLLLRLVQEGTRVGAKSMSYRLFAPGSACPPALASFWASLGFCHSGEVFSKALPASLEQLSA